MARINVENIDLGKLAGIIERYENQWIAISEDNVVVAHGATYDAAIKDASGNENVVFFKVPPLDVSLAP